MLALYLENIPYSEGYGHSIGLSTITRHSIKPKTAITLGSDDYNNEWGLLYSDALIDLKLAADKAAANEDWNIYLQAVSLRAFAFQIIADLYDQIPYSQSLNAEFPAPVFDNGSAVYDGLIIELDNALSKDFSSATNTLNLNDLVFGGTGSAANQSASWIDFANTMKLKLYLRQLEARPGVAEAGITSLINSGVTFLNNTDAAIALFEDADSKSFPLYETDRRQLNTGNNIRASFTLTNYLNANSDPRIASFLSQISMVPL